jgi:hypothetical protein
MYSDRQKKSRSTKEEMERPTSMKPGTPYSMLLMTNNLPHIHFLLACILIITNSFVSEIEKKSLKQHGVTEVCD